MVARGLRSSDYQKAKEAFLKKAGALVSLGFIGQDAHAVAEDPIRVMGLVFPNPVGLGAGFDVSCQAVDALGGLGFGFIEAGSVAVRARPAGACRTDVKSGSITQLSTRAASGLEAFIANLDHADAFRVRCGIFGASIAADGSKPEEVIENVKKIIKALAFKVDFLTLSSDALAGAVPVITEGAVLDAFSEIERFREDLEKEYGMRQPFVLKIHAGYSDVEIKIIIRAALECGIDAVCAADAEIGESRVSGKPLSKRALEVTRLAAQESAGRIPVISSGGILSVTDAIERLRAGASLVQVHSALVLSGPSFVADAVNGIAKWRSGQSGTEASMRLGNI